MHRELGASYPAARAAAHAASCVVTLSCVRMLTFAQPAGCADEIFKLGSRYSNGGSRAIPVGLLTASGVRKRGPPRTLARHLTTCASMGAGNPRNWRPGRSSQALARCGGWRRSSVTPLRDRPVGLAAQISRGGRGGLAAACSVSLERRSSPAAGRRAPPATPASVLALLAASV